MAQLYLSSHIHFNSEKKTHAFLTAGPNRFIGLALLFQSNDGCPLDLLFGWLSMDFLPQPLCPSPPRCGSGGFGIQV